MSRSSAKILKCEDKYDNENQGHYFIATWVFKIPIPGTSGYINLGDSMIYISAYLLGPVAAAASAIGSALADLAGGYAVYIPATFIIKGLMGLIFALLNKKRSFPRYAVACVTGGAVMTAGYAVFEIFVFGFAYALTSVPYNLAQWGGNAVIAILLYPLVVRVKKDTRFD
jgi:uncharacterized membrane protein